MLRHPHHLIGNAPAHQAKVAGIHGDADARQIGEQPIECLRGFFLEAALAGAASTLAVHHVGILPRHQFVHRCEQFGGVLKVGVDHQHEVAADGGKSGGERQLVTVIPRQANRNDVAVFGGKLGDQFPGAVGRAVVHKDQLESLAAQRTGSPGHLAVEFAQALFLVAAGDNDRQEHSSGARCRLVNFHYGKACRIMDWVKFSTLDNRARSVNCSSIFGPGRQRAAEIPAFRGVVRPRAESRSVVKFSALWYRLLDDKPEAKEATKSS